MPSTFLDYIESIRDPRNPDPGGGSRARRYGDRHPEAFAEAIKLVKRVTAGDRIAAVRFTEAMGRSDFPLLFGDIIDRSMVAAYNEWPSDIHNITKRTRVRDFRDAKRFSTDGAETPMSKVGERDPYPEAALSEARDTVSVDKYGRRMSFSWEQLVNDDLDNFRDAPARFGRAARRSEQKFITGLYVGATGLNTTLFDGTNTLASNPALTTDNLQTAITALVSNTDADGNPVWVDGAILVVGPALESTARRILNTTEFRVTDADSNVRILSGNALSRNLRLIVDPYISQVATSNAGTSWYLFADPMTARPALEFATLIGHEAPEVWVRMPNAQRIGGGTVGPDSGSFEHDSIDYRVRHVFGGAQRTNTGGKLAVVGSNGSGA